LNLSKEETRGEEGRGAEGVKPVDLLILILCLMIHSNCALWLLILLL
jgi:hypothetical protein